jgi:predicted lysophospholipase L1 biosynthesis ABC-type transport system permease subunit
MSKAGEGRSSGRDWKISAILLGIWIIALAILSGRNREIPLSMLAMATVFFVLLIPAMNDLVRNIEQYFSGQSGDADGSRDRTKG